MKKLIFTILVTLFCFNFMQAKKVFVEMEYSKNSIKLDEGSRKKAQTLKDGNGNDLKFISLIGALNYMSLQGWELLDTKSVISGEGYVGAYGGSSSTKTKVYYIFFKEVSDEELQDIVSKSYKE